MKVIIIIKNKIKIFKIKIKKKFNNNIRSIFYNNKKFSNKNKNS